MKVHHTVICVFFLLSLQDGNTGLTNAQTAVYSGTEGEDVTVQMSFPFPVDWVGFCKENCGENILIETKDVILQRGRYSIENKITFRGTDVFLTITKLRKSDSGLYECGFHGSENVQYRKLIQIIVVNAVLDENAPEERTLYARTGENMVVQCSFFSSGARKYFCKDDCKGEDILVQTTGDVVQKGRYSLGFIRASTGGSVYVSITQLTKSDSGRYRCAIESTALQYEHREFRIIVRDDPNKILSFSTSVPSASTPATTTQSLSSQSVEATPDPDPTSDPTTGVLMYSVVGLVIVVAILVLVLMIICIQRKTKPDGLITGGNTDDTIVENAQYENVPPVFVPDDSTYQNLHPATMDLNQTYATLTHTQHT